MATTPHAYRSSDAQGAEALHELVMASLDDDNVLSELATLAVRDGMFMPFTEGAWLISRFGFDFFNEDNAGFLASLTTVTRREAIAFAREHGEILDET